MLNWNTLGWVTILSRTFELDLRHLDMVMLKVTLFTKNTAKLLFFKSEMTVLEHVTS